MSAMKMTFRVAMELVFFTLGQLGAQNPTATLVETVTQPVRR